MSNEPNVIYPSLEDDGKRFRIRLNYRGGPPLGPEKKNLGKEFEATFKKDRSTWDMGADMFLTDDGQQLIAYYVADAVARLPESKP